MACARLVATLLAVAVVLSAATADAAVSSKGNLKPTPPTSLPAHKPHRSEPRPRPHKQSSGLPNTGINARVEIAVALLLLGCGAVAKAYSGARPAAGPRRR